MLVVPFSAVIVIYRAARKLLHVQCSCSLHRLLHHASRAVTNESLKSPGPEIVLG